MLDGLMDQYGNRRGEWYGYYDLAQISGSLAATSSSNFSNVDGLATENGSKATVLVGALDPFIAGGISVTLNGLSSLSFLGATSGSLRAVVERIPAGQTPANQYIVADAGAPREPPRKTFSAKATRIVFHEHRLELRGQRCPR